MLLGALIGLVTTEPFLGQGVRGRRRGADRLAGIVGL